SSTLGPSQTSAEISVMSGRFLVLPAALALLTALAFGAGGPALPGAEPGEGSAAGKQPTPKPFTLHSPKVALGKVLDDLARQTGVRVETAPGERDKEVAIDLKDAPFWQAVDKIASAAGARVYLYPRSGRI